MSLGLDKRIELEMRGRSAAQIRDLNLDNCRASKIEGLTSDFACLENLSLINLGLTSLENFPKLANLKKLELSDNRISSGLNHLTGCVKLTHLSLSGNKIKDFDVLDPLKDLPCLVSLDLFNCSVTQVPDYRVQVFNKLQQLIYLDGFDRNDAEQEDVDGEDDDDDDDDDEGEEDDDDDDESEEVGLKYLTKNIDEEDEEDEEDFDPNEEDDDDDAIVEGCDDDDEDDEDGEEGEEVDPNLEDGDDDDDDDDDDDEEEEGEGEEDEFQQQRGTKRKHEDEEIQQEDRA